METSILSILLDWILLFYFWGVLYQTIPQGDEHGEKWVVGFEPWIFMEILFCIKMLRPA